MKIMVTGGCGFIGSAVCRHLINDLGLSVVNVDKMTYAASEGSTRHISPAIRNTASTSSTSATATRCRR